MPAFLNPANCPRCQQHLELTYAQRRYAMFSVSTNVLFAALIVFAIVSVVLAFWGAQQLVQFFSRGRRLLRRDRGALFLLGFGPPTALVAWITVVAWRRVLRRPRYAQVTCGQCRWTGTCRVQELWV